MEIKCEYQRQYKSELHAGYLLCRTNYIEKSLLKWKYLHLCNRLQLIWIKMADK